MCGWGAGEGWAGRVVQANMGEEPLRVGATKNDFFREVNHKLFLLQDPFGLWTRPTAASVLSRVPIHAKIPKVVPCLRFCFDDDASKKK